MPTDRERRQDPVVNAIGKWVARVIAGGLLAAVVIVVVGLLVVLATAVLP